MISDFSYGFWHNNIRKVGTLFKCIIANLLKTIRQYYVWSDISDRCSHTLLLNPAALESVEVSRYGIRREKTKVLFVRVCLGHDKPAYILKILYEGGYGLSKCTGSRHIHLHRSGGCLGAHHRVF